MPEIKINLPHPNDPINWVEDYPDDNGNYECKCFICQRHFFGHKRRILCKLCYESTRKPKEKE